MSNREILREAHSLMMDGIISLESLDLQHASDRNVAALNGLKAAFRKFEESLCKGLVTPYSR